MAEKGKTNSKRKASMKLYFSKLSKLNKFSKHCSCIKKREKLLSCNAVDFLNSPGRKVIVPESNPKNCQRSALDHCKDERQRLSSKMYARSTGR